MLKSIIEIPENLFIGIYQTGSSVICDPPVTNTDIDFIICTGKQKQLDKFLTDNGFDNSTEDQVEYELEGEGFFCYRKDNVNLIVTTQYDWYLKWVTATKLAKKLNLLKKEDRITLFKFILYDEFNGSLMELSGS